METFLLWCAWTLFAFGLGYLVHWWRVRRKLRDYKRLQKQRQQARNIINQP